MLEDLAPYIVVGLLASASASGVTACKKPADDGPRKPTAQCELEVPPGWVRSPSPMPDHIAELVTEGRPGNTIIIGERPERDPTVAQAAALAYHRGGLLRPQDATEIADTLLADAGAPGRVLSLRWGPAGAGTVETISLVAPMPAAGVMEQIIDALR